MIFCVPVKNGWQFEQISTLMSPPVERVLNLFPQAQCTVDFPIHGMNTLLHEFTLLPEVTVSTFAHSKARYCTLYKRRDTSRILSIHRLQKFLIGLGAMHLVH